MTSGPAYLPEGGFAGAFNADQKQGSNYIISYYFSNRQYRIIHTQSTVISALPNSTQHIVRKLPNYVLGLKFIPGWTSWG